MPIHNPPVVVGAKQIATGSYTGDGTVGRQITTGFKCSLVILFRVTSPGVTVCWVAIPNATRQFDGASATGDLALHATDGFTVGGAGNGNTFPFYYWAISE
ncbi:hypothetical protein ES707_16595 [subsurface metagenome]